MNSDKKRKWLIPTIIGLVLLLLGAFLLSNLNRPLKYPKNESFAEVAIDEGLSDKERFDAYDHDKDPAHPVLDVKVKLYISNLGSRPGKPRPQNILDEPPQKNEIGITTPIVIRPNTGITLPNMQSAELYLLDSNIVSPKYIGDQYTISWEYTSERRVLFTVSLSVDGGNVFQELVTGLDVNSYELTFPDAPSKNCVLRVTAVLDGTVYKTADSNSFELVYAPELAPTIIKDYIDPQVQYVYLPNIRINNTSRLPVWFKMENNAENATKLMWQLSKIPFWGTKDSFGSEVGIVSSGNIDIKKNGEFSVDVDALCQELTKANASDNSEKPFLIKQDIYSFYIRVVALDKDGKIIGDPGRGLSFSYGPSDVMADIDSISFSQQPQIDASIQMWDNNFKLKWTRIEPEPNVLNRDFSSPPDMVLFGGLDDSKQGSDIIQKAVQVELQVATSPFSNPNTLGFVSPKGLVYRYMDTTPDIGKTVAGYSYITDYFHGIEYKEFVLSKGELEAMGGIYYYARALFYVPDSENPSILHPYPSETIKIAYRVTSASKNEVKQLIVKSNIPFVQFIRYVPIQWQDPNYDEYFEVTRHIEAEEMNFFILNKNTGDFLLPYEQHIKDYKWTREQYQAKLDEMLPLYASFRYEKNKPAGFWSEFFSLLKSIYSSVQESYADVKNVAIGLVDYIPLIGNDAKSYLKTAIRYTIDYGLLSIGLPPSLPNLDKLVEGGIDYCFKVAIDEALKQAGVPVDSEAAKEITEQVREEVTSGIMSELTKAFLAQYQNPFHADFVRLNTYKLYSPAYIDVLVANYSDTETSIGGYLSTAFGTASISKVYKNTYVSIPSLQPNSFTYVRIYLDHLRNKYDGYGEYFDKIYYGKTNDPFSMRISTTFNLKDVRLAAKEQGISSAALPAVSEFVYDHNNYEFIRNFIPAEAIWDKERDMSVDPADFGQ